MGRPWGLSGPEFLFLYAGLLVLVVAVVYAVRAIAKRDSSVVSRGPDLYELAYLHGGSERVADTVVASLVKAGALRVTRKTKRLYPIHTTAPRAQDELQERVLSWFDDRGSGIRVVRSKFRDSKLTDPIAAELRHRRLIMSGNRAQTVRVAALLVPCLGLFGLVRLINGMAHGYPVGFLFFELLVTVFVWLVVREHTKAPNRTAAGDQAIADKDLKSRTHWDAATYPAALVAAGGLAAYPDSNLAKLLNVSSSSGGGGFGGGGDGGGGGGGGCGGGGC